MQLLIHPSALELVPALPSLVEEAGLMVLGLAWVRCRRGARIGMAHVRQGDA